MWEEATLPDQSSNANTLTLSSATWSESSCAEPGYYEEVCASYEPWVDDRWTIAINSATEASCEDFWQQIALFRAEEILKQRRDELLTSHINLLSNCWNATEKLTISYQNIEQHYTLYYYDQAGSLVQTVPPEGVDQSYLTAFNSFDADTEDLDDYLETVGDPNHTLRTQYRYNTLGQLVWQETPDAGESYFFYDSHGVLRASQNAQQKVDNRLSYTKYDRQNRILEVGEMNEPTGFD